MRANKSFDTNTHKENEEFEVEGVFYSPMFSAVAYRGYYSGVKKKTQHAIVRHSATTVTVRADHNAHSTERARRGIQSGNWRNGCL
jgi:hypothetical protein